MKLSVRPFFLSFCLFLSFFSSPAQVRQSDWGSLKEYDPTPKAQEMTRYGNLPVDLNSGVVSLEIPLWTYSDGDFTIPVSLRYSSSGFRPGEPTGEAGLGWTLMAGGAITREIRGIDDFAEGGYHGSSQPSASAVYGLLSTLDLHDDTVPRIQSQQWETSSDVYHFTMPGHSGSFLIDQSGNFRCYGTQAGSGTYSVEYSSVTKGFTITAGDGYKYHFGCSDASREEMPDSDGVWAPLQPQEVQATIVTWLLEEIEAPDHRTVKFDYTGHGTPLTVPSSSSTDVVTSFGPGLNTCSGGWENPVETRYKYATQVYTSYLTGISVEERFAASSKTVFSFTWQVQEYTEEPSNAYDYFYTRLIRPLRKLSRVEYGDGGPVLRIASLSYTYRNQRPLLTSVSLDSLGTWKMEYAPGALAGLLTNAVDYWGFYNGRDTTRISAVAPTVVDGNYDESIPPTTVFRDPDTTGSMRGMLTKVTWPSGGSTTVAYEANRAAKIVLRRSSGVFLPALYDVSAMLHSDLCGGVRVRSVTDDDGLGHTSTRTFSYADANGLSSGIVQQFNRYFLRLLDTLGTPTPVMAPQLHFPGSGFDQRHVAYGSVMETFPDGSTVRTDFTSWTDEPDAYSTHSLSIPGTFPSGLGTDYDSFLMNVFREPDSRAYCRGLPKKVTMKDAAGNVSREVTTTYGDVGEDYAAYVVRCETKWYSARHFFSDRLPSAVTTVDHPSSGTSLTSTVTYSYDAKGRRDTTETVRWDGSRVRGITGYVTTAGAPALLPSVRSSHVREPGGSSFLPTEAMTYAYVHADSLWNLVSEVHTLWGRDAAGAWTGSTADSSAFGHYDVFGNPRQAMFNGLAHAFVWGYGGRYLVADVKGGTYYDLPVALQGTLPGGLSDTLVATLHALSGKEVRSFSYSPSVGVTRVIDRSGRSCSYGYDAYGRLSSASDAYALLRTFGYGTEAVGQDTLRNRTETLFNGSSWNRTDRITYDGLGRPYLEVTGKVTGLNAQELASLHHYDAMDRESRTYLPYAASTASVTAITSQQQSYWNGMYEGEGTAAYGELTYGGGSLSLVESERLPGSVMLAADKKTVTARSVNGVSEVPKVTFDESTGGVSVSGYRAAGTLLRTTTTTPDGEVTAVFSDDAGNPVLERRTSGTDMLDTYYAYDIHGRTRWVLTPGIGGTVRSAASSGGMTLSPSDSDAKAWCFIYRYGARGDVVEQTTPGAGNRLLEYDTQHRPVMERPAIFGTDSLYIRTYYDALGRLVNRAVFRPDSLDYFNPDSKDGIEGTDSHPTVEGTHLLMTRRYASSTSVDCISGETQGTPYAIVPSALAFAAVEGIVSSSMKDTHINGELLLETLYMVDKPVDPVGLTPIGNRDSTYVSKLSTQTAFYYDRKGRVIQRVTSWPDASLSRMSMAYDDVGNVTKSLEQYRAGTVPGNTVWLLTENSWDSRGNLLVSSASVYSGSSMSSTTLKSTVTTTYTYDGTGRLTGRTVSSGSHTVATAMGYTLQGWMESITATLDGTPLFCDTLRYWLPTRSATAAQYGGRISEATAAHAGYTADTQAYSYDGFGRYTGAVSYSGSSTTPSYANTERGITYDASGNLASLTRHDASGTTTASLSYERDGNRLLRVSDGVSGSDWSFSYDGGGNLTHDGRTGDYLAVNVLGLTAQVGRKVGISLPTETASYSYLADGTKVGAKYSSSNEVRYRGSFVYRKAGTPTPKLEAVMLPGGMVFVSGTTWTPHAVVTDHLGSTRAVANLSGGTVVERNDYYAFGTKIRTPTSSATYPQLTANRWRYSGKEEQDIVSGLPHLDYGARHYDAFLGSWTTPDPLADKYYGWSPYAFCVDDPMDYYDIDGNIITISNNYRSALNNIAKIAATSIGYDKLNSLVSSFTNYNFNRVLLLTKMGYLAGEKEIRYVNHTLFLRIDGGSPSPFVLLGHEIAHAYSDNINAFYPYTSIGRLNAERTAVGFENYLRTVYGIGPLRNRYSNIVGGQKESFNTPRLHNKGERITNFQSLNANSDKTALGFCYTVSFNNGESATMYLVVGIDEQKHLYLKKFDSQKDYEREVEQWQ